MPTQPTATQARLNNIIACLSVTADTINTLASGVKIPYLEVISSTTRSLLRNIQTIKQNENQCAELMEETYIFLNAILILHLKSETGTELPPHVLTQIGEFTKTLYKIHTFVEGQQTVSKVKKILRYGEMSTLLKDCKAGLHEALGFFQAVITMQSLSLMELQKDMQRRHREVMDLIKSLADENSSYTASLMYSDSANSSNSISMLPSEPKIFYGRESELFKILELFDQNSPRIALLGGGGMGKTSLAKAVIHHAVIASRYGQHRYFVVCESASNRVELAAVVGTHLGLKPRGDLTQEVVQYLSDGPPSLLILDNLETMWEPTQSRHEIEEFLSRLTDPYHVALMITMRGAERPAKVHWSRPFLSPLEPLDQDSARKTFMDIADDTHEPAEVDKILSLTDNMPLAINLLAHLVDSEGCSNVLSRWQGEKTSLISDGYDRRSNLNLSIALSLMSPRLNILPQSRDLLSLLSMLPDGLSDVDLVQSKLPIDNILECKAALIRTALAYRDEHKHLKVLVPIREYMQKIQPPSDQLVQCLLKHFQKLLEFYKEYHGTMLVSSTVARLSSNLANIQNMLRNRLQQAHPDLKESIYLACTLNRVSVLIGRGTISLIRQIDDILPIPRDYQLEACLTIELLASWQYYPLSNAEEMILQALDQLELFEDTETKHRFYCSAADYYEGCRNDFPTATKFLQSAISVAISAGNTKRYCQALYTLAVVNWNLADYPAAHSDADKCQKIAKIAGYADIEARSLRVAAVCWYRLGRYKQSLLLCDRAINCLSLCGLSGGVFHQVILNSKAEVHRLKSEYVEARNIQTQILAYNSTSQEFVNHALATLSIADLDVTMHAHKEKVQRNLDVAKSLSSSINSRRIQIGCECCQASLNLREGDISSANTLLCKALTTLLGQQDHELVTDCLERLADVSQWNGFSGQSSWPTVFLAHSLKSKEKLGVHKALQFLGDVFCHEEDKQTAFTLFTIALEGFTYMDVHRSRAECMLRLGDISKWRGDLLTAIAYWEAARPLFERSSQSKQVANIDKKLAESGEDMLA